jgi:hypothetical protein
MSGSMNSNDIEDFVSSVRRLVSADARPRPVSRDLGHDRLVLTPAFRVVGDDTPAAAPLILSVPVKDADPAPVDPVASLLDQEAFAGVTQTFEAEWEEEIWTEPEPPLSELALGAEEAELVTETPIFQHFREPRPERGPDLARKPDPAPEPVVQEPEPLLSELAPVIEEAEAVAEATAAPPEPAAPFADRLEDEAPFAEVGEDWLESDPVPSAPAGPSVTEALAGRADAERQASRPDVLKLSAEDMLIDVDGNPLTVLDEAALQQIIQQLIRDELKGVLGERITQSVRKLVRAEINRALAAHALD